MKRRPGHVLLTTDAVGGVWTYSLDLARGLAHHGVRTTLAVIGPEPGPAQRAEVRQVGLTMIQTGFPLDWWGVGAAEIVRSGQAIARFADEAGVDVAHLHAPSLSAEADFGVPVIGSCHSCLATWWSAVKGGEMPSDFLWRTELLSRGYAACDALIAPSRSFRDATSARYGVDPAAVLNGRGSARLAPGGRRSGVLTSGRLWDSGKNVAALDRAAARMRTPVAAAGAVTGPHGETITLSHIESLGHLGAASLAERLNQTAVFASLALYEPFGLGVLEAAQAGCALVLSDIPTFRELWDGAAMFVSPRDEAEAARVLDALASDPAERSRLARKARARAQLYTLQASADGTMAVYIEAMAAGAPMREVAA
ncbi:glycosyltransferase family 4 protein [Brevundimonas sp. PAMC22021]|uniref:glycosyltransferase family 4 protein n=1 Tax=Brevundimonas sp. PAMC22021 TaxID=2861285 RepID=UPI001C6297E4|nr:glycosyltransferase family 4 protein [Brevundimonas sp. PAMC22021]QYF87841.1 glycosyltransferase family 4 protein [Brevundimonas sp. PAMC22021]